MRNISLAILFVFLLSGCVYQSTRLNVKREFMDDDGAKVTQEMKSVSRNFAFSEYIEDGFKKILLLFTAPTVIPVKPEEPEPTTPKNPPVEPEEPTEPEEPVEPQPEPELKYETYFHHTQTNGPDGGQSWVGCPGQGRFFQCTVDGKNLPWHRIVEDNRPSYWNMKQWYDADIICYKGDKAYRFPTNHKAPKGMVYGKCK